MRHRLLNSLPLLSVLGVLFLLFGGAAVARAALSSERAPPTQPDALPSAVVVDPEAIFMAVLAGLPAGGAAAGAQDANGIAADTIRYRVCKDLSICGLEVAAPTIGLASPPAPFIALEAMPVPVALFALPPVVAPAAGVPWPLIAAPLLGAAGYALSSGERSPSDEGSGGGIEIDTQPQIVPEPATFVLLGSGLLILALYRVRRPRGTAEAERRPFRHG